MITSLLLAEYLLLAIITGSIGAILGIGGGIILVPVLTLIFNIPIHYAIGASITAVVATSTVSSASYIKMGYTNTRLGLFLEMGTAFGALTGAIITTYLASSNFLYILFSILLIYTSFSMIRSSGQNSASDLAEKNDKIADYFGFSGKFYDQELEKEVEYFVDRVPHLLSISVGAGIASGLLGVGGGFIKVPALLKVSKIPMKAASATSTFMIGITASTSALVYFSSNFIDPFIAGPLIVGTLFGSLLGTKIFKSINQNKIKLLFGILLFAISVQFFFKGFDIVL